MARCAVAAASAPTVHAPGGQPAHTPTVLQTTTDAIQRNNTGPLGGSVIIITSYQMVKFAYFLHFKNKLTNTLLNYHTH